MLVWEGEGEVEMAVADQSIFYYGPFLLASGRLYSGQDGGAAPVNRASGGVVMEGCVKFRHTMVW